MLRIALLLTSLLACSLLGAQNKVLMPLGHREEIDKVILSPNGRYAVSADWNKCILWEVASGFSIAQYERTHTNGSDICFSKTGDRLMICSGKNLKIFHTSTGEAWKSYQVASLVAAYFLDSANTVLIVTNDKLMQADVAAGKILKQVDIGYHPLMAFNRLVLSRDSRFLFMVGKDQLTALNIQTGAGTQYRNDCIQGNRYPIFAENGKDLVAIGCNLGQTFLFDRETGSQVNQLDLPFNEQISENGDTILTSFEESGYYNYGAENIEFVSGNRLMVHKRDSIELWDLNTAKKIASIPGAYSKEHFSADSNRLVFVNTKGYGIYNGATGLMEREGKFNEPYYYTNYVGEFGKLYSYNASNDLLLGSDTSRLVPVLVNLQSNTVKRFDTPGISDLNDVLLLSGGGGPQLYCGYENFCVGWDLGNGRSNFTITHDADYGKYSSKSALGSKVEASSSGKWLITSFNDFFNIFNFNTVSTCEFFRLNDHQKTGELKLTDAYSVSANDKVLYQIYEKNTKVIGILDLNTNKKKIISRDSLRAKVIAISSNGRYSAFLRDGHVHVYDAVTEGLKRGDAYQNWREEIDKIIFSPDGKTFVLLGFETIEIPVYSAVSGKLLITVKPSTESEQGRMYEWAAFRDNHTLMAKMSGYMYLFDIQKGGNKVFDFSNTPLQQRHVPGDFWALTDIGDTLVYCRLNLRDSVDILRRVAVPSRNISILGTDVISNNGKGATWFRLTTADTLKFMAEVYNIDARNSMFLTRPWYRSDKGASEQLRFLQREQLLSFEQLDLEFNRPDKVLQAIGSKDTAAIHSYKRAYYKRLQRLGIDTARFSNSYSIPVCSVAMERDAGFETSKDSLRILIHAADSVTDLSRLNAWVNDVPIHVARGLSITPGKQIDTSVNLRLSNGDNRIEVSVTNVSGIESYRQQLFVHCTPARPAPRFYFIGIGIDKFKDTTHNLSWSVKDIHDLATTLQAKFANIEVDTLFNSEVTKENILRLKQKLLKLDVDDRVILSYSGHGLLSSDLDYYLSTWNVDFEHPEKNGLAYDDLESLLDGIAPRQKLVLIDACHSGEIDKAEVARIDAAKPKMDSTGVVGRTSIRITPSRKLGMVSSFELMQNLFVNVSRGTGATVIAAAGALQFAQERGDLRNGVFTFSILDAFRKNNTLTISQLKKLVEESVSRLTNGLQQPTSRSGTHLHDWKVW